MGVVGVLGVVVVLRAGMRRRRVGLKVRMWRVWLRMRGGVWRMAIPWQVGVLCVVLCVVLRRPH